MADDPALPPASITAPAAASVEATNARMLNQTMGKLLEVSGSNNTDVVTALNSIASAITASLIGGTTGGTANRILVSKGTTGRALQPTASSLDPATGVLTAVSLAATLLSFTATQRVAGRNTSGAGAGEEVTLTQLLDWISASVARGDLLRRGASAWERVALGASGTVLTSNGTDPAWTAPAAGGITTIASGSLSGNAVTITDIPETYAYLVLQVAGGSMDTATRFPRVRVSVDNGSSYDATAANYQGEYWDVTGVAWAENTEASVIGPIGTMAAAATFDFTVTILPYQTGPFKRSEYTFEGPTGTIRRGRMWYRGATANVDALQIIMNSTGNFDAGTYALYGVS